MVLLHLLQSLKTEWNLTLGAVYINHNIRKRAAAREAVFCRTVCEKMKIAFHLVSEDIPVLAEQQRKALEETARDYRYAVFERLCLEHGYTKIALGHHIDDRVETILFRIIRGTGTTGLKGMPAKRGRIIRPLYDVTKEEILAYLNQHRLQFCRDRSNDGVEFSRNYIRNKLLPEIRRKLNPSVDRSLLNLGEIAAEDDRFLSAYAGRFIAKTVRRTIGGKIELDLAKYNSYDKWLRIRTLRYCLAELSGRDQTPQKSVVERLDKLAAGGGKAISLPNRLHAEIRKDRLVIYRRSKDAYREKLELVKWCSLSKLDLRFRAQVKKRTGSRIVKERRTAKVQLDFTKVVPPLIIRNILPGDKFQPLGLKGTKTVSDYLTDRKVDRLYRDEVPVVCDREGIIWLAGFEIADRVKIDSTTREVLEIEFRHRSQARIEAF